MRPLIISVVVAAAALLASPPDFAHAGDSHVDHEAMRQHHRQPFPLIDSRSGNRYRDRPEVREFRREHRDEPQRFGQVDGLISSRSYIVRQFPQRDRHRDDRDFARYGNFDYDSQDFPSNVTGNTYAGSLSAWSDPGNGIYFQSDRYGYANGYDAPEARRAGPMIIIVTPGNVGHACSWESGVCVIRR